MRPSLRIKADYKLYGTTKTQFDETHKEQSEPAQLHPASAHRRMVSCVKRSRRRVSGSSSRKSCAARGCAPAPPRALSVPSATPRVCSIARVNFLCINGLIYVLQICSYPQFQLPLTQSRAAWGRGRCDRSRSFVYSFLIRCRAASV